MGLGLQWDQVWSGGDIDTGGSILLAISSSSVRAATDPRSGGITDVAASSNPDHTLPPTLEHSLKSRHRPASQLPESRTVVPSLRHPVSHFRSEPCLPAAYCLVDVLTSSSVSPAIAPHLWHDKPLAPRSTGGHNWTTQRLASVTSQPAVVACIVNGPQVTHRFYHLVPERLPECPIGPAKRLYRRLILHDRISSLWTHHSGV